jgi:hypothetical protein
MYYIYVIIIIIIMKHKVSLSRFGVCCCYRCLSAFGGNKLAMILLLLFIQTRRNLNIIEQEKFINYTKIFLDFLLLHSRSRYLQIYIYTSLRTINGIHIY